MNRMILGAVAALFLAAAGLFWWQGRAETERGAPPPPPRLAAAVDTLPTADVRGLTGPAPPEASEVTQEQRRFDRVDRDRDQIITRNELMSLRTAAFKALDTDGNNLLTFEEWAVRTGNKFKGADRNGDNRLTRLEFSTTRPQPAKKPECKCSRPAAPRTARKQRPEPEPILDELDEPGETEPAI